MRVMLSPSQLVGDKPSGFKGTLGDQGRKAGAEVSVGELEKEGRDVEAESKKMKKFLKVNSGE